VAFVFRNLDKVRSKVERDHVAMDESVSQTCYKVVALGPLLQTLRTELQLPRAGWDDVVRACNDSTKVLDKIQHILLDKHSVTLGERTERFELQDEKDTSSAPSATTTMTDQGVGGASWFVRVEDLNSSVKVLYEAVRVEGLPSSDLSSAHWAKRDLDVTSRHDIPMDKNVMTAPELLVCWKSGSAAASPTVAAFFLWRFHPAEKSMWIYTSWASKETEAHTALLTRLFGYLERTALSIYGATRIRVLKPVDASGPDARVEGPRFCTRPLYVKVYPSWGSVSSTPFVAFDKSLAPAKTVR
jgi:hypothetical protein